MNSEVEKMRDEVVATMSNNGMRLATDFAEALHSTKDAIPLIAAGVWRRLFFTKNGEPISDQFTIIVASELAGRVIQQILNTSSEKVKKIHDILNDKA